MRPTCYDIYRSPITVELLVQNFHSVGDSYSGCVIVHRYAIPRYTRLSLPFLIYALYATRRFATRVTSGHSDFVFNLLCCVNEKMLSVYVATVLAFLSLSLSIIFLYILRSNL